MGDPACGRPLLRSPHMSRTGVANTSCERAKGVAIVDLGAHRRPGVVPETSRRALERALPSYTGPRADRRPVGFDPALWRRAASWAGMPCSCPKSTAVGRLRPRSVDAAIVAEELGRMVHPGAVSRRPTWWRTPWPSSARPSSESRYFPDIACRRDHRHVGVRRARIASGKRKRSSWLGAAPGATGTCSMASRPTSHVRPSGRPHPGDRPDRRRAGPVCRAKRHSWYLHRSRSNPSIWPGASPRCVSVGGKGLRGGGRATPGHRGPRSNGSCRWRWSCNARRAGATEAGFGLTVQYCKDRVAFGRPIGSYQALKHRMADHRMWLEGSTPATTYAAHAVQAGRPDAAIAARVAKAQVGKWSTVDIARLHPVARRDRHDLGLRSAPVLPTGHRQRGDIRIAV